MIRSALLLVTIMSAGGLWYVMAGAEGQAAVRTSALKLLETSSLAPEPPVAVITAPVRVKALPITRTGIGWI